MLPSIKMQPILTKKDDQEAGTHLHRLIKHRAPPKETLTSSEPNPISNDTLDQRAVVSSQVPCRINTDHSPAISTGQPVAQQSKSTGEFYFANDPLSKQQIIDQLAHEQVSTFTIRSLDDLEKHGLIQQTWLEDGRLRSAEGRLFSDKPLTLVFDLTIMTPGDIASVNDLLQAGPQCNGKPLGDQIRLVCLVNDEMLKGSRPANPDLWRRLRQMSLKEVSPTDAIADPVTDETLLTQKTTANVPSNKSLVTIDFAASDDWYHRLFGGITLNERGQLVFSEGALANLSDDTHLAFYNAPWDSAGFKETLATAIRAGGFVANRQWVRLPKPMTLSRDQVSDTQLNTWKSQAFRESKAFSPQSPFVCINSSSIENLYSRFRVEGTSVVRTDRLAMLLKDCRQLVITGELDRKQWLWLMTQLQQMPTSQRPLLFASLQPALLLSPGAKHSQTAATACQKVTGRKSHSKKKVSESTASPTFRLFEYGKPTPCGIDNSESEERNPDDRSVEYFTYEINPTDTLESLLQINLTSQNNFTFSQSKSDLIKQLEAGEPVILSGLERNPELAANLETLLLPNPYLFIHGHKLDLPRASVTVIRPAREHTTGSRLIDQVCSISDRPRQLPENPVYLLLKSLPRSHQKNCPDVPPWSAVDFQHQFARQTEAERLLDGSPEHLPCHQRRALHVLLAKAYRGDPEVYHFIKAKIAQYYPDQPADQRADRSALQQWLANHPAPSLKDIKAQFWTLAQYCPVAVHKSIARFGVIKNNSVQKLATYVVGAAQGIQQEALARRLNVDPGNAKKRPFFAGTVRSTLRDALIAGKAFLNKGIIISHEIAVLETAITNVLEADQTHQQKLQHIQEILAPYFRDHQLPAHYEDLPTALVANQRHTHARQERRLLQLTNHVQEHPIVFLQGEAGTGKSFMAQAVAARAGYTKEPLVIQLGPNRTSEELFGGQQLIRGETGNEVDYHTEFRQGPLLKWASDNNPPRLVLDEANLAPAGLLAPLAGLTRQPPVIHYQGHEYRLTAQHRIILTGNPDHYQGRELDQTLKARIPTFFYHPLPETVLARSIILPNLPAEWSEAQKQQGCVRLLTLFNHFKALVPGDLTTPRDIKDVLATVRQILSHCPASGKLMEEQVNALIRRAFMDSLAGAVTGEYQQPLTTLNLWYQGQYLEDPSILTGVDCTFESFLQQLQAENPDADLTPASIRQLVYHYWQSLEKDEGGRSATLVEGPAGWGKDFILGKTVRLWQRQQALKQRPDTPFVQPFVQRFVHINANPNQWSTLVNCVEQAMSQGQLIAISELNLIPSSYLEGLFNDVLTGHAAPGFRLFATVNPGSFDGREALSPALKSRCSQVRLSTLSQQELKGLVQRLRDMPDGLGLPDGLPDELPQWLACHFNQLSTALVHQNSPVQLTLDDLFSTAKHLVSQRPDQWQSAFQQHLALPLLALKTPLPKLQGVTVRLKRMHSEEQRRLDVERIANSVPGLPAPMTVKFGNLPRFGDRKMTVKRTVTDQQVIIAVQALLKSKVIDSKRSHDGTPTATSADHEQPEQTGRVAPYLFGDIIKPQHYNCRSSPKLIFP